MILFETIKNYLFLYIIGKNIKHENKTNENRNASVQALINNYN